MNIYTDSSKSILESILAMMSSRVFSDNMTPPFVCGFSSPHNLRIT